jgi:hypothetical protein
MQERDVHTEDEAKELWCPFSRAQGVGRELSHNRPDGSYNCIASGCAQWEWAVRATNPDAPFYVQPCWDRAHAERLAKGGAFTGTREIVGCCGLKHKLAGSPSGRET